MNTVHIYGAGSIGNHLAHACRNKGWDVTMADPDPEALRRTREDIYPTRYCQWDTAIALTTPAELSGPADVVIIGTPPDTHMGIAANVLREAPPRVLLIEKPLCTPDLAGLADVTELAAKTGTTVLTGYNHVMAKNTREAERIIKSGVLGKPLSISVRWLEHWGGIFGAHPWLSGPSDSYLGFSSRGGGACGEHSHGINLFQHFSRILGMGAIQTVSCMMDDVRDGEAEYDRICLMNVKTEGGQIGFIAQDVVTGPAVKTLRVQCENGFLEWYAGYDAQHDAIVWGTEKNKEETILIPRTRPDDFSGEIDEVEAILSGTSNGDVISMSRGHETMRVIAAARRSHESGRTCDLCEME
jgi:predicted dehydrogenase